MDIEMSDSPGARLEAGSTVAYHRDFLKRPLISDIHNRDVDLFLNPYDGRLAPLIVQCSGEISRDDRSTPWSHTSIKSGSPLMIRLSNWAMSRVPSSEGSMHSSISKAALRWIPACCALVLVASPFVPVAATPSNFGRYEPFLYEDWRYPREARNKAENKAENNDGEPAIGRRSWDTASLLRKRITSPKYLCVIQPNGSVKVSNVEEKIQEYVFISFCGEHFDTKEEKDWLDAVGVHAARTLGINAYWISKSCLNDPMETDEAKRAEE
ncbi:MAG: hypothetical protein Q9200_007532 [Gallowayella weberi]